jgi:hypothetical protein
MKEKMAENVNSFLDNYQGTYLFSSDAKKDVVYLQTKDKVYKVGKFSDCPNIVNQPNAYEITDIIQVYSCLTIPEKYKNKCDGDTGSVEVVMKSADDFQKYLEEQSAGNSYTPDVSICWQPSSSGGTGIQKDISNFFTKKYYDIRDYLSDHRDEIIGFVGQFGVMEAVNKTLGHFGMLVLVMQGFLSSNEWVRQKSEIMSGQIILGGIVGAIQEALPLVEKEGAKWIEAEDGQVYQVMTKYAGKMLLELDLKLGTRETLNFACSLITKVFGVVGYIQMAGMILDTIDPCSFNSMNKNLSQDMLDNIKETYEKSMFVTSGGLSYPEVWDPTANICDYDLDPQSCGQQYDTCLSADDKKKVSKEDYCNKDWVNNFSKYQEEYLDHLKFNSLGQDITKLTNKKLAEYFSKYVGGGIDWSILSTVNKENYLQHFSLPNNNTLRILDLYAVDNNAILASYMSEYWYLFASLFVMFAILLFIL